MSTGKPPPPAAAATSTEKDKDKDNGSNNDANHDTLPFLRLDVIKQKILSRHIHLWKPPYYGVRGTAQAVSDLAVSLLSSSAAAAAAADPTRTKAVVVQHLQTLQQRALQKLADKGKLLSQVNVKILVTGTQRQQLSWTEFPETWAATVVTKSQPENDEQESPSASTLVLVLQQPNPDLTIQQLQEDLTTMIQTLYTEHDKERHDNKEKKRAKVEKRVTTPRMILRFIHKGKTLPAATGLQELAHGGGTNAQAFLLCLIPATAFQNHTPISSNPC